MVVIEAAFRLSVWHTKHGLVQVVRVSGLGEGKRKRVGDKEVAAPNVVAAERLLLCSTSDSWPSRLGRVEKCQWCSTGMQRRGEASDTFQQSTSHRRARNAPFRGQEISAGH